MRNISLLLSLGFLIASTAGSVAQNARSYVSSTGLDSNTCTFASPCRHFQRGHDQTNDGGQLFALDNAADYGALTITKGISIASPDDSAGHRAFIAVASGNAITVNAPATKTVTLVNLELKGEGTGSNGVLFNTGGLLQVYGGSYNGFGATNGYGISFAPAASSTLMIQGVNIAGNGNASTGGGVHVNPKAGGGAVVDLREVTAYNNCFGLLIDTTGSTAGVTAVIHGGVWQYNRRIGIALVSGATIGATVDNNALVLGNAQFGVFASGAGATARLFGITVTGNATGVSASGGAHMLSYGNNSIDGNTSNGTVVLTPEK